MSEHGDSPTRAGELALRRLEAERITREKKVAGVRTLDWDGKEVVWLGGWVPSPKHENEFYSTLLTPKESWEHHDTPYASRVFCIFQMTNGLWAANLHLPGSRGDTLRDLPSFVDAMEAVDVAVAAAWKP